MVFSLDPLPNSTRIDAKDHRSHPRQQIVYLLVTALSGVYRLVLHESPKALLTRGMGTSRKEVPDKDRTGQLSISTVFNTCNVRKSPFQMPRRPSLLCASDATYYHLIRL